MQTTDRASGLRRLLLVAALSVAVLAIAAPRAAAHAELLQSSPAPGSVVGGSFHSITMHFGGLAIDGPHTVELFDPAGKPVDTSPVVQERLRLILPIEPLQVPGEYSIQYSILGDDNDRTSDSFQFRFDPAADDPEPVTLPNGEPGFDFVQLGLLLAGAALLAFLVHRFVFALREHRAAQALSADDALAEHETTDERESEQEAWIAPKH